LSVKRTMTFKIVPTLVILYTPEDKWRLQFVLS